jgi:hypothetical protein
MTSLEYSFRISCTWGEECGREGASGTVKQTAAGSYDAALAEGARRASSGSGKGRLLRAHASARGADGSGYM